jgi:hypothetical protein
MTIASTSKELHKQFSPNSCDSLICFEPSSQQCDIKKQKETDINNFITKEQ